MWLICFEFTLPHEVTLEFRASILGCPYRDSKEKSLVQYLSIEHLGTFEKSFGSRVRGMGSTLNSLSVHIWLSGASVVVTFWHSNAKSRNHQNWFFKCSWPSHCHKSVGVCEPSTCTSWPKDASSSNIAKSACVHENEEREKQAVGEKQAKERLNEHFWQTKGADWLNSKTLLRLIDLISQTSPANIGNRFRKDNCTLQYNAIATSTHILLYDSVIDSSYSFDRAIYLRANANTQDNRRIVKRAILTGIAAKTRILPNAICEPTGCASEKLYSIRSSRHQFFLSKLQRNTTGKFSDRVRSPGLYLSVLLIALHLKSGYLKGTLVKCCLWSAGYAEATESQKRAGSQAGRCSHFHSCGACGWM